MKRKEFSITDRESDDPDADYELEKDEDIFDI
jgi:hypothetical protein